MLNFSRKILSLLFGLFLVFQANAQVKITPIIKHKTYRPAKNSSNLRTLETPLALPFFDDFSASRDSLNYNLWERGGGTFLNNSLPLNPPSVNVVTFDGLDETGRPYDNFENSLATGDADILTSQAIDLSAFDSTSGVFLSFMWQSEGLGEEPDNAQTDEDFITLYFLGRVGEDSVWTEVWSQQGGNVQAFKNAIVQVKDSIHFWDGFKFRLISNGNLSGGFDIWNLDYFYMNSGRTESDTFRTDAAVSKVKPTFLKRYYSMPYNQYLANPTEESIEDLSLLAFNLASVPYSIQPTFSILKDTEPVYLKFLTNTPIESNTFLQLSNSFDYKPIVGSDSINPESGLTRSFKINYDIGSPPADTTKRNDTLSTTLELSDYYAYDDGSAEAAFNLSGITSRLAYRFYLNEPATISKIRVYYPQQIKDISGTSIKLLIWDNNLDTPDRTIGQVAFYTDTINKFLEYNLASDEKILLSDTFYIGYEQTTVDPLPIGFDKNTNSNQQIFYRLAGGNEWTPFTDEEGSLMIRPVFEIKNDTIVGNEDPVKFKSYKLFPNPTIGIVKIEGEVEKVAVFDPMGKFISEKSFKKGEPKEVNLNHRSSGIYILHIYKGRRKFVEKVILQK